MSWKTWSCEFLENLLSMDLKVNKRMRGGGFVKYFPKMPCL